MEVVGEFWSLWKHNICIINDYCKGSYFSKIVRYTSINIYDVSFTKEICIKEACMEKCSIIGYKL